MRTSTLITSAVAVLSIGAFAPPTLAQNLTDVWVLHPKAGVGNGFEAALRDHMEWRTEAGDPWRWSVYTVETGPDVGAYIIRSSGHSWADFDAYEEGFGPQAGLRVAAGFGNMIQSVEHRIEATDTARTRAAPNPDDMNLFNVVTWYPRAGQMETLNNVINKFFSAIEEHDHPTYYTVLNTASGSQGPPSITVAFHNANWAGFADPDPSIMDIMQETYSEEEMEEIQEQFGQAMARAEDYVVRLRRDLSGGGS
ncbi:MAG TPA: hypothetical protein VLA36_02450 [Longimicrobiales bacterium]|nr:hypothetical protein [Longimicrobiales bacterium]